MTILHVFSNIAQSVQGRRTRFQQIIESSNYSHYIISSLGIDANYKSAKYEKESGTNWILKIIKGYSLEKKRGGYWLNYFPYRIYIIFEVLRNKIKLIHVHDSNAMSMAGAWVARLLRLPFIYEVHTLTSSKTVSMETSLNMMPLRIIMRSRNHEKYLVKNAKCVIVQTGAMAKQLSESYGLSVEQIIVLPNKIDTNHFNPKKYSEDRNRIRKQWGVKKDDVVFLYAGYINWYNGIKELLMAFKNVAAKNARLFILGDGDLRKNVVEAASCYPNKMYYMGTVASAKMPKIYAAADCVMMARPDSAETREATPMKLLEAMSMARVIICSRVDGLMRICDEQTGLIVEPGNIDELQKTIEYVCTNYTMLTPKGINARNRIVNLMKKYNSSEMLDLIYDTYKANKDK